MLELNVLQVLMVICMYTYMYIKHCIALLQFNILVTSRVVKL